MYILDLNLEELKVALQALNAPAFAATQILSWIYKKRIDDFVKMSNLPLKLRKVLAEKFRVKPLTLIEKQKSSDATEKFLFRLSDGKHIEAVRIPAKRRITACLSTQAGCKFACRFCASGSLGFKRNLSAGEIIAQALYLGPTHIVFMGIGEPLDNYDNVLKAIRIMNSPGALNIGARRITISTCGIIPGIERLAKEGLQVELSVSLHSPDEKTRSQIMPVNKIYPLKTLLTCLRRYIEKTNRQVTFEYTLAKGLNSDLQNAGKLSKILAGLNCKVNLIAVNPVAGEIRDRHHLNLNGVCPNFPARSEILAFKEYLESHGIHVTLRQPRGYDIAAACGQLRLRYEDK